MPNQTDSTQTDAFDCDNISSPKSSQASTIESLVNFDSPKKHPKNSSSHKFTSKSKIFWRLFVAVFGISVMFFARVNVPDNPVSCIEDKVMNAFQTLNNWINLQGNEFYRSAFLFACGSQIDLIFFSTLAYWVFYGKTGRLPVSIAIFYGVRALVQAAWWSPYPAGFYWESPGFPSFVAPYGKASDFFFSGHSGFLVLMANEWNILGNKKVRNYCLVNLVYTILLLLVYQAHYSIDIFTGVFFADYVFRRVNENKEKIDGFWRTFAENAENIAYLIRTQVSKPVTVLLKKNN